jgi:hypothetical protein
MLLFRIPEHCQAAFVLNVPSLQVHTTNAERVGDLSQRSGTWIGFSGLASALTMKVSPINNKFVAARTSRMEKGKKIIA